MHPRRDRIRGGMQGGPRILVNAGKSCLLFQDNGRKVARYFRTIVRRSVCVSQLSTADTLLQMQPQIYPTKLHSPFESSSVIFSQFLIWKQLNPTPQLLRIFLANPETTINRPFSTQTTTTRYRPHRCLSATTNGFVPYDAKFQIASITLSAFENFMPFTWLT